MIVPNQKLSVFNYNVRAEVNIGQSMTITQHDVDKIIFGNMTNLFHLIRSKPAHRFDTVNPYNGCINISHIEHMRKNLSVYESAKFIDYLIQKLHVSWRNDVLADKLDALDIYLMYNIGVTNDDIDTVKSIIHTVVQCNINDPMDEIMAQYHDYGNYVRSIVSYHSGINY